MTQLAGAIPARRQDGRMLLESSITTESQICAHAGMGAHPPSPSAVILDSSIIDAPRRSFASDAAWVAETYKVWLNENQGDSRTNIATNLPPVYRVRFVKG